MFIIELDAERNDTNEQEILQVDEEKVGAEMRR